MASKSSSTPKVHEPFVTADRHPPEVTLRSVLTGIAFGILFGAANAYLGLKAGLTISTSIPVAVMTVAAFRLMGRRKGASTSILEANLSQTVGSASSSVASGVIFTLPALFMWGMDPPLLQMTLLAMCGGLLGVLFMIPLRRFLIEREHGKLPYPEGTACAEVLMASEVGGAKAQNVFLGLTAGAVAKGLFSWLKPVPDAVKFNVPLINKAQIGCKLSAALFGVGFILGPRVATIMVAGGLLSSIVIIPLIAYLGAERATPMFPETEFLIRDMAAGDLWHRYVRYIGAGAVAAAGLITLVRSIPTMIESFRIGLARLKARAGEHAEEEPRTGTDLGLRTVAIGVTIIALVMALVPQVFGVFDSVVPRVVAAVCVVVFAFFFVTVASRIVGLVGVTSNPTSGMTIASLLATSSIFLAMGWTDATGMAGALAVGCVVAIAASISGDTSQDLKTGFIVGATPYRQQVGELVGVITSSAFVCLTLIMLHKAQTLGSDELAAPQATLMKLVIEGVLRAELPWNLVAIGAGIAVVAELIRIPSLPFAVGVYLPVSTMVPVFLGGLLRKFVERTAGSAERSTECRDRGILFGSGLVGGEGLLGVIIAGVVFVQKWSAPKATGKQPLPLEIGQEWAGTTTWLPPVLGVVAFALLGWIFIRRCRATDA